MTSTSHELTASTPEKNIIRYPLKNDYMFRASSKVVRKPWKICAVLCFACLQPIRYISTWRTRYFLYRERIKENRNKRVETELANTKAELADIDAELAAKDALIAKFPARYKNSSD